MAVEICKSGCGVFKVSVLFQNVLRRTVDNHEKSGSGEPIYCQRSEPWTSQI